MKKIFLFTVIFALLSNSTSADDLTRQKADYDSKAQQALEKSEALKYKIESVSDEKRLLDEAADQAIADYEEKRLELNQTLQRINDNQLKLENAKNNLKAEQKILGQRVRDIYINGKLNYIDVLFGASNFADFMTRMDLFKRIIEQDYLIVRDLLGNKKDIENYQVLLEQDKDLQIQLTQQAEELKDIQLEKVNERQELINNMLYDKDVYDQQYNEMLAASEMIQQMILEREAADKLRREAVAEKRKRTTDLKNSTAPKKSQSVKNSNATKKSNLESNLANEETNVEAEPEIEFNVDVNFVKEFETGDDTAFEIFTGMTSPVDGEITSEFGWRTHPIFNERVFHSGIDIAAEYGTPILAAQDGVVSYAGWISGYGNTVMIDHGEGITSLYGHNQSLAVSVGDEVEQGEIVAFCGSTGNSTGPHCHFEIRQDGEPVSPWDFLQ